MATQLYLLHVRGILVRKKREQKFEIDHIFIALLFWTTGDNWQGFMCYSVAKNNTHVKPDFLQNASSNPTKVITVRDALLVLVMNNTSRMFLRLNIVWPKIISFIWRKDLCYFPDKITKPQLISLMYTYVTK